MLYVDAFLGADGSSLPGSSAGKGYDSYCSPPARSGKSIVGKLSFGTGLTGLPSSLDARLAFRVASSLRATLDPGAGGLDLPEDFVSVLLRDAPREGYD